MLLFAQHRDGLTFHLIFIVAMIVFRIFGGCFGWNLANAFYSLALNCGANENSKVGWTNTTSNVCIRMPPSVAFTWCKKFRRFTAPFLQSIMRVSSLPFSVISYSLDRTTTPSLPLWNSSATCRYLHPSGGLISMQTRSSFSDKLMNCQAKRWTMDSWRIISGSNF